MKATRFRWLVISLVFLITVINYIDRSSIAYAITIMQPLFHFSADQVGLILGAFGLGYFVTTFLGGVAVDRYGARIVLSIGVLAWSCAMGFTGLTTGFLMAYIARAALGLAEGPNFPAMARITGDWLPETERALALSCGLIAVPIALALGAPLASYLITHFGWRAMFFILGAAGLLWLPLWYFFFQNFPQQSARVNSEELSLIQSGQASLDAETEFERRRKLKGVWRVILFNPTLLATNWAFFVFGYFMFFFMTWLPNYLKHVYHLDLTAIGWFSVLPWGLAALALWAAGLLSDTVFVKTKSLRLSRSYPIWVSQLLSVLCVLPLLHSQNLWVALTCISLAVAFTLAPNAAFYAVHIDVAKERAGTSLGVMELGFALSGFLAPVFTGWIISTTHNFTDAFILMIALGFSSVLGMLLFHRPEKSIKLS